MTTSDVPPGWSHNPSGWSHRLPMLGLALVGFVIAAYLARFQFGGVQTVWEPFFGNGSEIVLRSWVSQALPIPDAALGALAYLCDLILGSIGGHDRWRTRPWAALMFGVAVCVFAATSVLLILVQVTLQAFCTLCLVSAAISIVLVWPALDELRATWQHVERVAAAGEGWWRAVRGLEHQPGHDQRSPGTARERGA